MRHGVRKDPARASALYRRIYDLSSAVGCASLGIMHAKGNGVPQDLVEAASFFSRACDMGEKSSCGALGSMYAYRKACDLGEAQACVLLGANYDIGVGVAQDSAALATAKAASFSRLQLGRVFRSYSLG